MSGLNVSLAYMLLVTVLSVSGGLLLRLQPLWSFSVEFPASFMLVASWLEVQTLMEVGQWAGGFGPDVNVTLLFLVLVIHGVISRGASGNPSVTLMRFLTCDATCVSALSGLAGQFLGTFLARLMATYYWSLELTDMHMIKNMMMRECSPALRVGVLQGVFTEGVCALTFHLLYLNLQRKAALLRVPFVAATLAFLSYAASGYTSGFINPSLAYALTFHCPGYTLFQYMTVYWLGPLAGMILALFLYLGNIPRIFTRNLLYSQKTRFRVPKGKSSQDQAEKTVKPQGDKKSD
ncbi:aquaporin 12 [Megalops cyprinoides]|uniref:aquaporin 12 n=1 Tax=Megalops cyprinoides TaxID=118141 RepID=UPI0018651EE7|nr:aquaporin 12 [Megalops cyprinoides]